MEEVWKSSLAALRQLGSVTSEKQKLLVSSSPSYVGSGTDSQGYEPHGHPIKRHFLNTNHEPDTAQEKEIRFSNHQILVSGARKRTQCGDEWLGEKKQAESRGQAERDGVHRDKKICMKSSLGSREMVL